MKRKILLWLDIFSASERLNEKVPGFSTLILPVIFISLICIGTFELSESTNPERVIFLFTKADTLHILPL